MKKTNKSTTYTALMTIIKDFVMQSVIKSQNRNCYYKKVYDRDVYKAYGYDVIDGMLRIKTCMICDKNYLKIK